jgi:hypothetical protein
MLTLSARAGSLSSNALLLYCITPSPLHEGQLSRHSSAPPNRYTCCSSDCLTSLYDYSITALLALETAVQALKRSSSAHTARYIRLVRCSPPVALDALRVCTHTHTHTHTHTDRGIARRELQYFWRKQKQSRGGQ